MIPGCRQASSSHNQICFLVLSDCETSAATLWERMQKKYWPQKVSFGSPDVLKTIVSPHVPLYPTLMSLVSLQVHHKVSKTSSKMKGLSLTASKWGKDLFWSAFIFHSQGKLAYLKLRTNCLKVGEVFLSKWSHITSSLHYRARGPIGFLKVRKKVRSRLLFLFK